MTETKTWTRGPYTISTDAALVPLQTLNDWFASDELYWASPLPLDALQQALQNCLCFGLYYTKDRQPPSNAGDTEAAEADTESGERTTEETEFIGIARCITDHTTFVYLTDVYVHSPHQGKGLGRWLVECVGEVIDGMPYLRRSMLFTTGWEKSVPFYAKILGMSVQECRSGEGMAMMMRRGSAYPKSLV